MKQQCCIAATILLAIIGTCAAGSFSPDDQSAVLNRGMAAFERGTELRTSQPTEARAAFREAAEAWSALIEDGVVNGPLLYNLGNALFLEGDTGHAIAAYLRAQMMMPDDPRVAENLSHARTQVTPQLTSNENATVASQAIHWVASRSPWLIWTTFAIGWAGFWSLLALRKTVKLPGLIGLLAATGLLSAASATAAGLHESLDSRQLGVITGSEIVVRKGGALSYEPQFAEPLNPGVECEVLDRNASWAHIALPNGQTGWVPESDMVMVADYPSGPGPSTHQLQP
ncbi:MAG: hypothetical protein MK100_08770 [Phycisphaerales bacterium]|nr:hypothetical protein [Phycisphaerales bacterium]